MRVNWSLLDVVIPIVVVVNILVFILNIATVDRLESQSETPPLVSQNGPSSSILAPLVNDSREQFTPDQDAPGSGLLLDDAVSESSLTSLHSSRLGESNPRPSSKFDSRPVYFLHIYKSGGTSFCATARGAKKHVPSGLNCNLARGFSKRSASEQLEVLNRYEVAANEYDGLPASDALLMPRNQAAYVVFLRDPLDRLLSHFAAAQVFSHRNQGAFKDLPMLQQVPPSAPGPRQCHFHDCSFASFLHWLDARSMNPALAPAQLHLPWTQGDFLLRYLVGFDACAPGTCTEAHLARGMQRLSELFEIVVLLEDLPAGWAKMYQTFGWPSPETVKRSGTKRGSDARRELANDEKAFEVLLGAVGPHDQALYAHAKKLVQQ